MTFSSAAWTVASMILIQYAMSMGKAANITGKASSMSMEVTGVNIRVPVHGMNILLATACPY